MCTVYKLLHQKIRCTAADVGLKFKQTNPRSGSVYLEQDKCQRAYASYFSYRTPSIWNNLSYL